MSHAASWYAVIDNDDHTESTPYPTARDAMNRSAAVRGDGMGAASTVRDLPPRRTTTTADTVREHDPLDARLDAIRALVQSIRAGGLSEPWQIEHNGLSATAHIARSEPGSAIISLDGDGAFRAQFTRNGSIWSCWRATSARAAYDACKPSQPAPAAVTS